MESFNFLLILLIICLLVVLFLFFKKILKVQRENRHLKKELNFWIELFSNCPFPFFIIEKEEIKWQNKKALEILGDLRGKKKNHIESFLKNSYWDAQIFFLPSGFTVYLLLDKREEKILKRSYEIALAYLSHELKTPFTIVKNYAEKLEEEIKKNRFSNIEYFEKFKNSLERVERLIYKLFSSLEYLVKDLKSLALTTPYHLLFLYLLLYPPLNLHFYLHKEVSPKKLLLLLPLLEKIFPFLFLNL